MWSVQSQYHPKVEWYVEILENGQICDGAWHESCYRQCEHEQFLILQAADLVDKRCLGPAEALDKDDLNWFKCACDGDHLMFPFQCDGCHFYNIQQWCPGINHKTMFS